MNDLISRQDAIRLAEQGQIQGFEWQFKKLCTLPSAKSEIIRCKDCVYYDGRPCGNVDYYNTEDDYCSRAKRRDK